MADASTLVDALQTWIDGGELASAIARRRRGEELTTVEALLRKAAKNELALLDEIASSADILRDVPHEDVRRDAKLLRDAAAALRAAATPEALRAFRVHRWKDVTGASQALKSRLQAAWGRRCEDAFLDHERLAKLLVNIDATHALGKRMSATAVQGLALASRFPDASVRSTFEGLLSDGRHELDELTQTGLTEGLKRLLLAIVEGNATLADISPEAFDWLRKADALRAFQVSLR